MNDARRNMSTSSSHENSRKRMRPPGTSGQDESTESDLLASLGSTLQNMDEYERDVLKTAELEQTPRISGQGFPSLVSMAPSGRPLSDLPHFQTVLANIRQHLTRQPHNLKLLIQQQMLLNVVHTTTNDVEKCLRPQEEFRQEQARRQRFQRPVQKDPSLPRIDEVDGRKGPLKSALKGSAVMALENDEVTAAHRLEEIKQKRKTVMFASTENAPRRRIGIQKRRAKNTSDTEESEEELERRKEHLKRLRLERDKRRRKRRNRWLAANASQQQKANTPTRGQPKREESEEEELEFDMEIGGSSEEANEGTNQDTVYDQHQQPLQVALVTLPPTQRFLVPCPLCQEQVEAMSQEVLDERLSLHISACQSSRRLTRRSRQSLRRAASTVKSYAEDDDMYNTMTEADPEEEEAVVPTLEEDHDDLVADANVFDTVLSGDEGGHVDHPGNDRVVPHLTALDDFEEEYYEDRVDDWIENGIARMRIMKERDESEQPPGEEVYEGGLIIPAWINDSLFPYQRTGLQWMWELHRQQIGGIIGDEMGLGKTVQLCAFLGSMAASRKLKSILVIAPATMLQHWLTELNVWAPGIRRIMIHQSAEAGGPLLSSKRKISPALLRNVDSWLKDSRRHRLFEAIDEDDYNCRDPSSFCGTGYAFVTTYENLRRNPDVWIAHPWSYVVMDEAQKIRNPDADITLVCKRLRTPHRLALSGTPIQNDLRELWSLFDFVFPGRLGTLPAFENEFADPIKRGGYSNASPMQAQLAYRCALVLRDLINPYLLRRLKKDIKEVNRMPGKKEQVLFCRLSSRQTAMYEAFLKSDQVKQAMNGSTQMLGAITMLRKICNHPDLICPPDASSLESFIKKGSFNEADVYQHDFSDDDGTDLGENEESESAIERSGKLEVLAKILPLWKKQGHRVLIFCQWKKMLNIIQRFTESQGWKFGRLDGNTNVASRQRLVDQFNSDDSFYGMLMTTRTGGVGLNLTGANRIILYDPDWNPQTDAQARERAWRFGQEKEVTIYRLISAGTVEEKIYQRQIFKTALSNRILQDPRQKRFFSQKDLKDLFSFRVDAGSISCGAEGITETGMLTKGEGYVDPDQDDETKDKDNGETMQSVFQSKGLAGVFDHDLFESNKSSKTASTLEMEETARKVARAAAGALKESVAGHDVFAPTWTGSEETQGSSRFTVNRVGGAASLLGNKGPGVARSSSSGKASTSSNELLASIRQRNEAVESEGNGGPLKSNMKKYKNLLQQIQNFVRRHGPTTDELIHEFPSVDNEEAAVFRQLLKSVARLESGRWRLKPT